MRDDDAKTSIINALNAVFGADKVKSDISVDKAATPAPWLGNFRAALEAIKGANVDAIFQGDKINVGGAAMGDAARDNIIAALKSAVGASVAVGALTDKTAAAVAVANDRATTELASLQSGFGVKDLLFALNDSVVNFASDSAEVPESAAPFLKIAAADLKQLKAGHVLEIAGYTDNTGDAALNLALSQKRAEAVREALIKYGADADMLVAKGYGEADPVASNDTAEGRLKNRRIEYHVVKAPTLAKGTRTLLAGIVHVRAQHGVDSRLPTAALPPIGLDHVRIEAQRLIDLRAGLSRTAASPSDCLSRVGAEDLANEGQRRSRPLEVLAGPFGTFVIGPRGRVDFFPRHSA